MPRNGRLTPGRAAETHRVVEALDFTADSQVPQNDVTIMARAQQNVGVSGVRLQNEHFIVVTLATTKTTTTATGFGETSSTAGTESFKVRKNVDEEAFAHVVGSAEGMGAWEGRVGGAWRLTVSMCTRFPLADSHTLRVWSLLAVITCWSHRSQPTIVTRGLAAFRDSSTGGALEL